MLPCCHDQATHICIQHNCEVSLLVTCCAYSQSLLLSLQQSLPGAYQMWAALHPCWWYGQQHSHVAWYNPVWIHEKSPGYPGNPQAASGTWTCVNERHRFLRIIKLAHHETPPPNSGNPSSLAFCWAFNRICVVLTPRHAARCSSTHVSSLSSSWGHLGLCPRLAFLVFLVVRRVFSFTPVTHWSFTNAKLTPSGSITMLFGM